MHEACFKLFTRCVATRDQKGVDKDVLYAVMMQSMSEMARHLDLDFGPITGAEQFWDCFAGDEWSVTDPVSCPGIEDVVQSMLPATLFDQASTPLLDLSHRVRHDPLTSLPYDVLHGIFAELSIKDTLALIQASWHVHDSTRDPAFWRLMIRVHIVSFFSELDNMLNNMTFPDTFDWRAAFQWLNEITKPKFAMEGPLCGIANRRRIWDVCLQLKPRYLEKLHPENYQEPGDDEAADVLAGAKSFHMPLIMHPQPSAQDARAVTTQFVRSWSEIGYRACDFDTYWKDDHSRLVGISVTFGSVARVFGSTEGVKGVSMHIGAGEWISEIVLRLGKLQLHVRDADRGAITGPEDPKAVAEAHVKGMVVS
jgi:hypothetical protein